MPGFPTDMLYERLDRLDGQVRALLAGEKLDLDPSTSVDDHQIIALLRAMAADGDLDAPAPFYYVTPEDKISGRAEIKHKAKTHVHAWNGGGPDDGGLIGPGGEEEIITAALHDHAIANAQILGVHFFEEWRADNFILPARGDLHAAREMLTVLRHALDDGHNAAAPRSLTIDNSGGRWTPLLTLLDLETLEKRRAFNAKFVNGRQAFHLAVETDSATIVPAVAAFGHDLQKRIAPPKTLFQPGQQPMISMATKNAIKAHDAIRDVKKNRLDVWLVEDHKLGERAEGGLEFGSTYSGNADDKLVTAVRHKLKPENLGRLLEDLSAEDKTLADGFVLSADGGGALHPRVAAQPEFDGGRDLVLPGMPWPGVEIKNEIARQGTTTDFYETVNRVIDRLGGGDELQISHDTTVWEIAPLQQDDPDHPFRVAVKTTGRNFITPARPADAPHKQDKHYLRPDGYEETLAELEQERSPYLWQKSSFARGLNTLLAKCGVEPRTINLQKQFNAANGPFQVLAIHQLQAGFVMEQKTEIDAELRKNGMQLMDIEPVKSLHDIRAALRRADGILIMPGSPAFDLILNGLIQSTVVECKQLHDPLADKPTIYYRHDAADRGVITRMFDQTKRAGLIGDHYDDYFGVATTIPEIAELFLEAAADYVRPKYTPLPPDFSLPDVGMLPVTCFLSASSGKPEYADAAYEVVTNLALNGISTATGLGRHGPMGIAGFAPLDAPSLKEATYGTFTPVMGVQEPYAMQGEGWPGAEIDAIQGPGYTFIAGDDFQRTKILAQIDEARQTGKTKVIYIDGGGAGTIKEIMTSLWLAGNLPNVHFVLHNTPTTLSDGTQTGPYDTMLKYLPRGLKRPENFHVCTESREVIEKIGEILDRKLQYHDVKRTVGFYAFEQEKNPRLAELLARAYSASDANSGAQPGPC